MGNIQLLKRPLLYKGKYGGCIVVLKTEQIGSKVKLYTGYGESDYPPIDLSEFEENTHEYRKKEMVINEENKPLLESYDLKIERIEYNGKYFYKILPVLYESFKDGKFTGRISHCKVKPFYNNNELFFELREGSGTIFIVTPERFQMCYRGLSN